MNAEPNRLLVVDDEPGIREGCRRILRAEGYEVLTADRGEAALPLLEGGEDFALALVDLKMPGMNGMELVERIHGIDENVVCIMITAYASIDTAVEATKRGAYGYIPKPFTPDELLLAVRNGLERRALSMEARSLRADRERRLLEVALERSKLNTIINCMTDGVIVINREGQVVLRNASAARTMPSWAYLRLPAPLEALDCAPVVGLALEVRAQGEGPVILSREMNLGASVFMVNAGPVIEPVGEVLGTVMVFRDITALKKLEKAKSMFVSMVAHEVKSPLSAIEGYLDIILSGAVDQEPDKHRHMLERLLLRTTTLRTMVAELLNLTAIETGNYLLKRSPQRLGEALDAAVEAHREKAEIRQLHLEYVPGKSGASMVLADANALQSIFGNLIENAVKYNRPGGTITVTVENDGVYAVVNVQDTGIGIAEADLHAVFDEFYRIRTRETADIPGTGLGLSLTRKLVEMLNGTISIKSRPGSGSTFTVRLPLLDEGRQA